MWFSIGSFKQFALVIGFAILVGSCGTNNGSDTDSPGVGSALVPVPVEDRRIAIVHSQTSKTNFYDPFAYNQLFASMQHQAMMAGLPFDLLDEAQLAGTANLLDYDAIVIPAFSSVKSADRPSIVSRLVEAQQNGVGLIASGEFMGLKEDGTSYNDFASAMVSVFGVQPSQYLDGVSASVKVAGTAHPINRTYQPNEELVAYDQIWFGHFVPAGGEQSTPLAVIEADGGSYTAAQVVERGDSRTVHFANDQVMADHNYLWRVIQWVVYGDIAPLSLQVSRADHVFLARNDMDQAMIAAQMTQTEIPLLDIMEDWKRDYNFVGSYYIDIGNNPAGGEYTDWSVSGPLYKDYIAMGNEIATHSWTHPHYTSGLNAAELEFEFKDSAEEIGARVGEPVIGAAVPGQAESLFVVETLNQWLDYLSGRTGSVGSGYQSAFGFLEPQHDMMYFSLNMSPDFTLIDYLNRTPAESTVIWRNEIDGVLKHAQTPLVHWLWHDYGPTIQTAAGLYTKEMFTDTIAYAAGLGAEFATVKNLNKRIKTFAGVDLSVGSSNTITANVGVNANAEGVGQFSLKVADNEKIHKVQNWYAYSDDRVFLPDNGGEFTVTLGATAAPVTRITSLPMRSRLIAVTGDGNILNFTMHGEGEVKIALSDEMKQNTSVTGAQSFSESNGVLTLQFDSNTTHVVELTPVTPLNVVPVATGGAVQTESGIAIPVVLTGTDANGDSLSYSIESNPSNGVLTGIAPNLIYIPNTTFTGTDSFTYRVSDGVAVSPVAAINIQVNAATVPNSAPVANQLIFETLSGQGQPFTLGGSDNENQTLTFQVITPPANGTLSGTIPNLVYTPNAGFTGRDELEFVANDSIENSAPASVVFNVDSQLVQVVGTVSNIAPVITIDGNLSEWSSMTAFDADPQDISGANNDLDWRDATMAHNATDFFIAYREHGPAGLTWGNQIFIDTDTDASTGFKGFSHEFTIGADFVIEGDALFRYTGDSQSVQNDWLWQFLGSIDADLSGNSAEIKVSRAQLENPENMLLFFYGNSTATGGSSIDYYPDNANDPAAVLRTRHFSYSVNSNVTNGNIAPIAFGQQVQISGGTSYPLTLTGFDYDGDLLTYIIDQPPQSGTLTGTAPNLVYTPNTGATQDSITYRVNDGTLNSAVATVVIDVLPTAPVNQAPTANGQSLTAVYEQSLSIVLGGGDPDQDPLGFTVLTQPQGGVLTGTAPNLTYTPGVGFSGVDSFTFKVDDGDLDSAGATVTIDVAPPANGAAISNPVTSLAVDGSLADWNGLLSLGDDPADIAGVRANNPLDWREAWVAHSVSDLYIAYRNHDAFSLSWGHGIYIDTDGDINTGFRGFSGEFPIGADILIETDDIQQYTGNGTNWGWLTIAQASVATNGEIGELSAPLSSLGNPQNLRFYFRANNSAFGGNTVDHFPDAANDPAADASTRSLSYQLSP